MTEPADEDDGLSEYERRFVEAYMGEAGGCATHAVQLIGTQNPASAATIASRLIHRPHVQRAIREREAGDPLVGTRIERLRFYTGVMRGTQLIERIVVSKRGRRSKVQEPPTLKERLEAAQTLSKICGDFLPAPASAEENRAAGLTIERLFALMQGGQVQ